MKTTDLVENLKKKKFNPFSYILYNYKIFNNKFNNNDNNNNNNINNNDDDDDNDNNNECILKFVLKTNIVGFELYKVMKPLKCAQLHCMLIRHSDSPASS